MKSIEDIQEDIIQTRLEINKYKEISGNKDTNWRVGKDMYDPELVEERKSFFEITNIINEKIESNNTLITQLQNGNVNDTEKLELLEKHNHSLIEFIMDFFK